LPSLLCGIGLHLWQAGPSRRRLSWAAAGNPAPAPAPQIAPRQVIVVTEPTELISTDGAPAYSALPGNELLYVTNTQSDVFMEVGTQTHYVLLSGRWYRTRSLQQGPWEFVPSDRLPQAFANIPVNSPKALAMLSGQSRRSIDRWFIRVGLKPANFRRAKAAFGADLAPHFRVRLDFEIGQAAAPGFLRPFVDAPKFFAF